MKINFEKKECILDNINIRGEKHGDESKPAFDMHLSMHVNCEFLKENFNEEFAKFLFDDTGDVTHLRFKDLAYPITYNKEIDNCDVVVRWGALDTNKVELYGMKANKFKITPIEGGSIKITFRIQGGADHEKKGYLCDLVLKKLDIDFVENEAALEEAEKQDDFLSDNLDGSNIVEMPKKEKEVKKSKSKSK